MIHFLFLCRTHRITNDSQSNQVQAPPSHVQQYSNDSQSAIDQNNSSIRSIKVNGKTSFLTGNGIGINNISGNGNINSDKIYLTNNVDRKNVATHQQQQQQAPQQQQQQPPPQPHIGSIKSLYEELTKTVPYQNRGSDFITYLLNSSKANTKAQAVVLLNSLIENGYLLSMNANAMDENSDGDRLVDFNENYIYRLLKTNDGISNSNSSFALNLDVDNNSSYLNRQDPNMMGKWHTQTQFQHFLSLCLCLSILTCRNCFSLFSRSFECTLALQVKKIFRHRAVSTITVETIAVIRNGLRKVQHHGNKRSYA